MKTQATLGQGLSGMVVAGLFAMGCVTAPQPMEASKTSPAAEGTVKAVEGDSGNTVVTIRVKHLAPPSRMARDATVYVVWVQPVNMHPQNVGVLGLDADLEGTMKTLTPHRRFRLLITPEPNGQVEMPSHEAVFISEVERH